MHSEPPPPEQKRFLSSGVFDWGRLDFRPTAVGARGDVFDTPTATLDNLECHVTTVIPGAAPHAPHRHADEELLFVKEGTIEVMINHATMLAGPGSVVFFASGDLHGLRNGGFAPATYYVLRIIPRDLPTPVA
jgi:mannose-6-phosphate isomerase-like protein (cupin superfamily)